MNHPPLEPAASSEPAFEPNTEKSEASALEILLFGCIALGAVLRVLWVGKREFWYDEVLSVLLSSGQKNAYRLPEKVPFPVEDIFPLLNVPAENGVSGTIETVKNLIKGTLGDPHPPLFYLSEHGWMRLFGNGEVALRSLGLLVSLLALLAAYMVGRRVLGQRGGLIFTALLALNPFFLSHSLNLRMYAPMVLWVLVSGGCLLASIGVDREKERRGEAELEHQPAGRGWRLWLLRAGVAIALAAGLLTQYLFAYWLFALAALALYLDRKRWFQHGLTLGTGVLLFVPWALWGTRQQINNRADVLNQISAAGGPLQAALKHGQDLAQTTANHLLLGHLTTGMAPIGEPIKPAAVAIGCGVLGFVVACIVGLWRRRQYRALAIAAIMALVPLAVALSADTLANKYTLGFGWGRSVMVALPGGVLLVAAWLELATGRWRGPLTAGLLAVYLAVNVGDFVGRDRQIFHAVNHSLLETGEPTLVVMNSRAWGHVLRLVYYLNDATNTEILATAPAAVPEALEAALAAGDYRRVLWLRADYPLWNVPETEAEAAALTVETEELLQAQYALQSTRSLKGTMNLDRFELQVYDG